MTRSKSGRFIVNLLPLLSLFLLSSAQDFDFFYFVLQWPGSYCDTQKSCCYPSTGKPESDFGIHGLWPNYNDGSYPSNCDFSNPFQMSKVSDLLSEMQTNWPTLACPSGSGTEFWTHEWEKHGTCSETVLDQHSYFKSALDLKNQMKPLEALKNAGIEANGGSYSLQSIKDALKEGTGYTPFVECNKDESGNYQLYQLYFCVDSSVSPFECSVFPHGKKKLGDDVFAGFADLHEVCDFAVKAMVCRKWDAHNSFGKYLSTEFILSDPWVLPIREFIGWYDLLLMLLVYSSIWGIIDS